ncbi:MAG: hypothetical protein ACRDGR_01390 [bacterium]
MQWILLTLVAVLIATGWLVARGAARLRQEIGEVESRLARRFYTLQGRITEIDATVRELEFDRKLRRGEIRFDAQMTLGEAAAVHPKVQEIFAAFGLAGGGCSGPGVDGSRTIREACREASLDPGAVLGALARFAEDPSAPVDARASTAKLHRIAKLS